MFFADRGSYDLLVVLFCDGDVHLFQLCAVELPIRVKLLAGLPVRAG